MDDLYPAIPIFRAVAEGNLGRARRRYLRECGTLMDNGDVTVDDGAIITELSGDEHRPVRYDFP